MAVEEVLIFEHMNYGGKSQPLPIGTHELRGTSLDRYVMSSLKVPKGLKVTLYDNERCIGDYRIFYDDCHWLGDYNFNDKAVSLKIEKV